MHTHHSSLNEYSSSHVANVLVETLKRTANNTPLDLFEIAQSARTTSDITRQVLAELTGLDNPSGVKLGSSARFRLAQAAVEMGAMERTARALTWQEFEDFSEECLSRAGFETWKGVVFENGKRRWQVDIAAVKAHILLSLDCKHWESPQYLSKFDTAIEHQIQSLGPLIRYLRKRGQLTTPRAWALPMVVTLFEPRQAYLDKVVMVSAGQLPKFLEHLTPYDEELPFVQVDEAAESAIS